MIIIPSLLLRLLRQHFALAALLAARAQSDIAEQLPMSQQLQWSS